MVNALNKSVGEDTQQILAQAWLATRQARLEVARTFLKEIVRLAEFPDRVLAKISGSGEETSQLAQFIFNHGTDFPEPKVRLGDACSQTNDSPKAGAYSLRALELDPKCAEAGGSHAKTLQSLQLLLHQELNSPELQLQLGDAYSQTNDSSKAIAYYLRALELDPKCAEAHANLSGLYRRLGRLDKTEEHANKAIELNPQLSETFKNLGWVFEIRGQFVEAGKCFEKVVELDRQNPRLSSGVASHFDLGELNS